MTKDDDEKLPEDKQNKKINIPNVPVAQKI